jgi:hypothetical protein
MLSKQADSLWFDSTGDQTHDIQHSILYVTQQGGTTPLLLLFISDHEFDHLLSQTKDCQLVC